MSHLPKVNPECMHGQPDYRTAENCLAIVGIERARFRMIAIICSSALL
jgi:hypothetical protein